MYQNDVLNDCVNSVARHIVGIVTLSEITNDGSVTNETTYTSRDKLKEFTIEKIGQSKFYGFGVTQKLNVKLIDVDETTIKANNTIINVNLRAIGLTEDTQIGTSRNYYPSFFVTEVHKDELTKVVSITAYDILYACSAITLPIDNTEGYSVGELINEILSYMSDIDYEIDEVVLPEFERRYTNGVNFEERVNLRELLDAIAEVTQTIYYVKHNSDTIVGAIIVFKRPDRDGEAVLTIDKAKQISLDSGTNRRLGAIVATNELGNSIVAYTSEAGTTQYIRNNPFYEKADDDVVGAILEDAIAFVGGLTINQFDCTWRGNPMLEIGDKIAIEKKDGTIVTSFFINDTLHYNGALSQKTYWKYIDDYTETATNPTTLGEKLKQTFATVDKVNKEIQLVASETSGMAEQIAEIQIQTDSISQSVQTMEKITSDTTDALGNINTEISLLTKEVETKVSADDVSIMIKSELENGIDKVTTSTGFTFNEEGLTVEKSDSEIKTTITEDGMSVYRNNEEVLTANNTGVYATNLHATTYLIIGNNSRFEDFVKDGEDRTACFWIGL